MKKALASVLIALVAVLVAPVGAAERGTEEEAMALVKRAAGYLKEHGKEKAFAEFHSPSGGFKSKDLYIIAFLADGDGIVRANGANYRLVGKNVADLRDADGKYFIKHILDVAKTQNGKGWVDYKWPNPTSGAIEAKRTYVERVDDVLLGCGVYK